MRNIGLFAVVVLMPASCVGSGKTNNETTLATTGAGGGAEPSAEAAAVPAASGRALADSIMAQWQREHPDRDWEAEVRRSHPNVPEPADNRDVIAREGEQNEGITYGRFTDQDVLTWRRETEKLVLAGARVFHDAEALGSTVAVSCDMCHPDAANTHPETYPKFQVQMGRVILLRDMINWCLINPLRAEALAPDDPKMRALEAYILAQRKGVPLEYGKH